MNIIFSVQVFIIHFDKAIGTITHSSNTQMAANIAVLATKALFLIAYCFVTSEKLQHRVATPSTIKKTRSKRLRFTTLHILSN